MGKGALKNEWIVIGGHYDHVGEAPDGCRANAETGALLGADDNASGTAAVLMLAKRLSAAYAAAPSGQDLRSVLFVAFTAEERGLVGSRYFVKHSPVPLGAIRAMLNLDMVGRLRQNRLWLSGFGTAVEYPALLGPVLDQSGLKVITEPGTHSSDQVSFQEAGIPVLFATTGEHEDVHTPSDLASTLNPEGAAKIIDFAENMIMRLAGYERALRFVEQAAPAGGCCAANKASGAQTSSPCCARPGTPAKDCSEPKTQSRG
jgi:Zn-dependent M28 family amino/carboxypeptidase